MLKSKMRLLGASALIGAGLLATGSASAANVQLGGWNVQIDNTVSIGASWLQKDVEKQYLPISNGGPADTSLYGSATATTKTIANTPVGIGSTYQTATDRSTALGGAALMAGCDTGYGGYCQEIIAKPNFDGSINTDDGRLNFDQGDMFSSPFRLTTEAEASNGPWTVFGRLNIWHDVTAMDEDAYNRGGELTDDGEENAGQNIELLDAYVSYDGDIGDMPFTLRAGRQVINWGEATFIPGGNSAFNPIDVAALRRPGAEIKEALLPVEALYGSIALTQDISLEAYVGGWDKYRLEAGGTPNGISDSFIDGTKSGNPQDVYFIGGGYKSGDQFACNGAAPMYTAGLGADGQIDLTDPQAAENSDNKAYLLASASIINAITGIDGAVNCTEGHDAITDWDTGKAEAQRVAAGDTNIIRGLDDEDGDSSFGLAVRWYAENLNSTEFALYYQKTDSRLPYISYKTGKADIKAGSTSSKSSTVGRGAGVAGCAGLAQALAEPVAEGGIGSAEFYNPLYAGVGVNDSKDILSNATLQGIATQSATAVAAAGAASLAAITAGIGDGTYASVEEGAADYPFVLFAGYDRSAPAGDNVAYMQETICLLNLAQLNSGVSLGSAFDGLGQLHTGATNLAIAPNLALYAEFPEVETYGLSFNTTFAGWGVQGDFTYRPEVPMQHDTDSLTIAGLFNNCAFATVTGLEAIYLSGSAYNNEYGTIGCTDDNETIIGYTKEHDAFTWDIGTTATFTRSNPVVSFLRSDLGIFLTEFQGVYAGDIEEDRGDTGGITALGAAAGNAPLNNVCVGGSDLPLNGILSIDDRTAGDASTPNDDNVKGFCRPTDSSWGVVLMAQLQYNNVFGTPIGLKPQVVYSTGIDGYSPSPIGFWREGVGSTAVSLTADYLGTWSANLSYRTYHGDLHRTRNLDRDVLSASVTYAF